MDSSRPAASSRIPFDYGNEDDAAPAVGDPAKLASFLHQAGKLARLYVDPTAFANPAWDIMLTLYLGDHDDIPVSRASLAAGNRLSESECNAMLETLETKRLVDCPEPAEGQPKRAVLTENGRERMRAFLRSAARD